MDTSTLCPVCMHEDAVTNGYCRFCKKKIRTDIPAGVLPPGVVLHGRYLTGLYQGQGGFGTIYRGLDMQSRQIVAIKEYYPTIWCHRQAGRSEMSITSPEEYEYGLKHFFGEAEILHSLQNIPEVVRLYDTFSENKTGYYVMEYLYGDTLQQYLRSHRDKIAYSDAVSLLMPAILGFHRVHLAGALHRDISPDNIFLCRDGSTRLIDFGASASKDSDLSRSFIPVEKEGYSPPEQHTYSSKGDSQGPWSDVYAMTGTLYRCISGIRPPNSSARLAGDPLVFDHTGLSQQQISVLEKNLSMNISERSQSMLELAQELTSCLKEKGQNELRARFPMLEIPGLLPPEPMPAEPESVLTPEPKEKQSHQWQILAFILDMFFFQAVPFAISQLTGGSFWTWIAGGLLFGVLVTWLMTLSPADGSPGEVLCGLNVLQAGRRPSAQNALFYCLFRILWPLKPVELLFYLLKKRSLNAQLSGCCSVRKGSAPEEVGEGKLALKITEGFFEGSSIELTSGRYVFGRNPDLCNFVFPMAYNVVSRVHLILIIDAANNIFITNRSGIGTWVDGQLIPENQERRVTVGSTIVFGNEKMVITYA